MDKVQQEVDTLYKEHFGKMVASLLYSLILTWKRLRMLYRIHFLRPLPIGDRKESRQTQPAGSIKFAGTKRRIS
jgi:hypothetical protein